MAAQLASTMDAVREAVHSKAGRAQLEQVAEGSTRALEAAAEMQAALDAHAAAAHAAQEDGAASARGLRSELRGLQEQLAAAVQGAAVELRGRGGRKPHPQPHL